MKPRIVRHPEVKNDLMAIAKRIGRPHAKRFLAAAEAAFQRLREMPYIAGLVEFDRPELAGMHVWPIPGFENYLIFYRPNENGVLILQVIHGARDLERHLRS